MTCTPRTHFARAACAALVAVPIWSAASWSAPATLNPADAASKRFYLKCMDVARTNPGAALHWALAWVATGEDQAATHCAGSALQRLGRHVWAAPMLDRLADRMTDAPAALRIRVLQQAAQSWLRVRRQDRAIGALNRAVGLDPKNLSARADRGHLLALTDKLFDAVDDFNVILEADPKNADILVLRAAVYRRLKSLDTASDDLNRALKLKPNHPDALLERGILRLVRRDVKGARADWRKVIRVAPSSAAAAAARQKLAYINQRLR